MGIVNIMDGHFCEVLDNDVEEGHESLLFNTVALMVAIGTKSQ